MPKISISDHEVVDVARERFESALSELLSKADAPYHSESDNESIPDSKERLFL